MSQEESEHNEVDGMKKGVDSKGEVMHIHLQDNTGSVLTRKNIWIYMYLKLHIGWRDVGQ